MDKKLAIVGNGPSRNLFTGFDGDVCVCNIPQLDVEYKYCSIVDRKALDYIHTNKVKVHSIYTTQDLHTVGQKRNMDTTFAFEQKLMNSAATASFYFADKYDVIYLYGCDALWSNVTTSHQDELIPRPKRNANLHNQWRTHWQKVWDLGKNFVIVHPKDITPQDYGEKVMWYASTQTD